MFYKIINIKFDIFFYFLIKINIIITVFNVIYMYSSYIKFKDLQEFFEEAVKNSEKLKGCVVEVRNPNPTVNGMLELLRGNNAEVIFRNANKQDKQRSFTFRFNMDKTVDWLSDDDDNVLPWKNFTAQEFIQEMSSNIRYDLELNEPQQNVNEPQLSQISDNSESEKDSSVKKDLEEENNLEKIENYFKNAVKKSEELKDCTVEIKELSEQETQYRSLLKGGVKIILKNKNLDKQYAFGLCFKNNNAVTLQDLQQNKDTRYFITFDEDAVQRLLKDVKKSKFVPVIQGSEEKSPEENDLATLEKYFKDAVKNSEELKDCTVEIKKIEVPVDNNDNEVDIGLKAIIKKLYEQYVFNLIFNKFRTIVYLEDLQNNQIVKDFGFSFGFNEKAIQDLVKEISLSIKKQQHGVDEPKFTLDNSGSEEVCNEEDDQISDDEVEPKDKLYTRYKPLERIVARSQSENTTIMQKAFVDDALEQLRKKLDNKCDFVSQTLKDRSGYKITAKYSDYEYSFYMYFDFLTNRPKVFCDSYRGDLDVKTLADDIKSHFDLEEKKYNERISELKQDLKEKLGDKYTFSVNDKDMGVSKITVECSGRKYYIFVFSGNKNAFYLSNDINQELECVLVNSNNAIEKTVNKINEYFAKKDVDNNKQNNIGVSGINNNVSISGKLQDQGKNTVKEESENSDVGYDESENEQNNNVKEDSEKSDVDCGSENEQDNIGVSEINNNVSISSKSQDQDKNI